MKFNRPFGKKNVIYSLKPNFIHIWCLANADGCESKCFLNAVLIFLPLRSSKSTGTLQSLCTNENTNKLLILLQLFMKGFIKVPLKSKISRSFSASLSITHIPRPRKRFYNCTKQKAGMGRATRAVRSKAAAPLIEGN